MVRRFTRYSMSLNTVHLLIWSRWTNITTNDESKEREKACTRTRTGWKWRVPMRRSPMAAIPFRMTTTCNWDGLVPWDKADRHKVRLNQLWVTVAVTRSSTQSTTAVQILGQSATTTWRQRRCRRNQVRQMSVSPALGVILSAIASHHTLTLSSVTLDLSGALSLIVKWRMR